MKKSTNRIMTAVALAVLLGLFALCILAEDPRDEQTEVQKYESIVGSRVDSVKHFPGATVVYSGGNTYRIFK